MHIITDFWDYYFDQLNLRCPWSKKNNKGSKSTTQNKKNFDLNTFDALS